MVAGQGTEEADTWADFAGGLAGKDPFRLTQFHIHLFWDHLQWSLQVPVQVQVVPPVLAFGVSRFWTVEVPMTDEEKEVNDRQKQSFRKLCKDPVLLLVPVYDDGAGPGGEHWTLLVVFSRRARISSR